MKPFPALELKLLLRGLRGGVTLGAAARPAGDGTSSPEAAAGLDGADGASARGYIVHVALNGIDALNGTASVTSTAVPITGRTGDVAIS